MMWKLWYIKRRIYVIYKLLALKIFKSKNRDTDRFIY